MFRELKSYFITGLLLLIPVILTLFLLFQALNQIDKLIPYRLIGLPQIPGLGIIMVITIILLTGMAAKNYMGRKFIDLGDKLVARIPVISRVYEAIKQILETFFSNNNELFKKVVLIEYPRKGIFSIGFLTQDTRGLVQDVIEQDVISVFLPTTPNPTSGFLLFVPKTEVSILSLSVEEAMKLIVSGGAIVPKANSRVNSIVTVKQPGGHSCQVKDLIL